MASVEIVLSDARPPRRRDLTELATIAGLSLDPELLELQTFAVEARHEEGPFPLPATREQLLRPIERLMRACQAAIETSGVNQPTGCGST
jgi:hypothetical protein